MCVYSMVMDKYDPWIPTIERTPVEPLQWPITVQSWPTTDIDKLKALIEEFKRLVQNAKEIDTKTGQPDCADPEKAKLVDRVAELEKLLADPPEVVIVKGGNITPGRYRIIGGKMYKALEDDSA